MPKNKVTEESVTAAFDAGQQIFLRQSVDVLVAEITRLCAVIDDGPRCPYCHAPLIEDDDKWWCEGVHDEQII